MLPLGYGMTLKGKCLADVQNVSLDFSERTGLKISATVHTREQIGHGRPGANHVIGKRQERGVCDLFIT